MKFGCILTDAFRVESHGYGAAQEWIKKAWEMGLDGIEVFPRWPIDWWLIEQIKGALEGTDLMISMVTVPGCNFCCHSPHERQQEQERAAGYIHLARELGTQFVRITAGQWDKDYMAISRQKAIGAVVETLVPVLEYAAEHRVILALENHPGMALALDVFLEILERIPSPSLGINFDTGNARRADQEPMDFLQEHAILDRIVHLHVKNFRCTPEGWVTVLPAEGDVVDLKGIFHILKINGYDSWISWEVGGKDLQETYKEAKVAVDWLRSLWNSL